MLILEAAERMHALEELQTDEVAPYANKVVHSFAYAVLLLLQFPSVDWCLTSCTLRDYTNVITAKSGFQCEVDEQLFKEAKMEELDDHQKYIALIFDEVKIKEDKHSGEMIGFVNVTDINHHLSAFEQQCHSEVLSHSFATHMLVFMVRGLFSSLEFPYVQFPRVSSTGDVIHPLVWQCIEHLELIGLKVLAVVCDGATPNRKFFRMHGKSKDTYKSTNIYEKSRPIYFISDVPIY